MIHEVDEALRLLLTESGLRDGGVELVFDPPTRDWAARRNAPTVNVFLYGIREDPGFRQIGAFPEYDREGVTTALRPVPRWFDLAYLVTAWTNRPQDEHRLLSEVMRRLIGIEALPPHLLTGTLAELGLTVRIDVSGTRGDMPSSADVWSGLGGDLKPALDLRVLAPLTAAAVPAPPPVTEGARVRLSDVAAAPPGNAEHENAEHTENSEPGNAGPGRGLRYRGAADPGPGGFGAPRERSLPPGRRHRQGGPR